MGASLRRPTTTPTPCERAVAAPGGLSPKVWGPKMWDFLHSVAWGFPVWVEPRAMIPSTAVNRHRRRYYSFFRSLADTLPCGSCCDNYAALIKGRPHHGLPASKACVLRLRVFDTRDTLTRWLYNVHNCIRRSLDQPVTMTYRAVKKRYARVEQRTRAWRRSGHLSVLHIAWNAPNALDARQESAYKAFILALPGVIPDKNVRSHALRIGDAIPHKDDGPLTRAVLTRWVGRLLRYERPTWSDAALCARMGSFRTP